MYSFCVSTDTNSLFSSVEAKHLADTDWDFYTDEAERGKNADPAESDNSLVLDNTKDRTLFGDNDNEANSGVFISFCSNDGEVIGEYFCVVEMK